ncbi:uncharacterized protein LOC110897616 [Helianthus annuus]|uniref:uncharacterized protein LOC110897616 n=1 Tax=Helianthus annuus TaxID=4232 RepID=UPI000B8F208F|nr:uncharacterized protein LOC110897616 [Helianthus annuus]XP_022000071.1 uncharacterized protein LOC110897616 [Helianthus annuus]XP_035837756.1 uncharacterized protein LOC110897616 [Helianthus annuus]XP_035837757.1 uncharacterized protein LOC110897616 [Helianthus annuus]XP_035837758.1 uncharacterized protein LOC110897616 [Helianthus annuus]
MATISPAISLDRRISPTISLLKSTDFIGDVTRSTDFIDDFTFQICEILGFLSPAIPTSDLLGSTSWNIAYCKCTCHGCGDRVRSVVLSLVFGSVRSILFKELALACKRKWIDLAMMLLQIMHSERMKEKQIPITCQVGGFEGSKSSKNAQKRRKIRVY